MSDKSSEEKKLKGILSEFETELKNIENESIQKIVEVIKKDDTQKISKAADGIKNII